MKLEPIRYHSEQGWAAGVIVARGRSFLHCIFVDAAGLTLTKLPVYAERNMVPLEYKGTPYPPRRAAKHLRAMGRKFGITKSAKLALRKATKSASPPAIPAGRGKAVNHQEAGRSSGY